MSSRIHPLISARSLLCSRSPLVGDLRLHAPTARPADSRAPARVAVCAGRSRRAAHRPLHPRDRQPDGRGSGRRRAPKPPGASSPRRSSAARRSRTARSWCGCRRPKPKRRSKEAEANAAQIEARLGTGRRRQPSTSTPCRKCRTRKRVVRAGAERVRPDQVAARSARRLAVGVRPAPHADGGGAPAVRSRRRTAPRSSISRCRRRARASTLARKALADTRRARAVLRRRRRAARLGRRLRHQGHEGRASSCASTRCASRLTVPEQFVSAVGVGQPVTFEVDAYPGPAVHGHGALRLAGARADQRALTVEAVVPNAGGELKPGLFATARIEQPDADAGRARACRAPCRPPAGTSRVYVVNGDRVEERIVTIGQTRRRRWSRSPTGSRPASASRRRTSRSSPTARKVTTTLQGRTSIMQWLAALSVRRPVFATVLILSLTVVGAFSFIRLGVDRFPEGRLPDHRDHDRPAGRRA